MKCLVLGAGVIGTTTAYFLAKDGHEVTVVDRRPAAAMETSFGNGGVLHTSECEPWSRPEMVGNVLRWLGKEDAPLLLRYGAIPKMWRWGLQFARNCNHDRYMRNTRTNMVLSLLTLTLIKQIREEAGITYDHLETGSMKIYTSRESMANVEADCRTLAPLGLRYEAVDVARCVALEPALEPIAHTPGWRALLPTRRNRRLPQVHVRAGSALRATRRRVRMEHHGSCASSRRPAHRRGRNGQGHVSRRRDRRVTWELHAACVGAAWHREFPYIRSRASP